MRTETRPGVSVLSTALALALLQPVDADRVLGGGTNEQQEAVFLAVMPHISTYGSKSLCLGVSIRGQYSDPAAEVVRRVQRRYPGALPASTCSGPVVVVGPFWRAAGRTLAYGGEWSTAGRCRYRLTRNVIGRWRAKQEPCILE